MDPSPAADRLNRSLAPLALAGNHEAQRILAEVWASSDPERAAGQVIEDAVHDLAERGARRPHWFTDWLQDGIRTAERHANRTADAPATGRSGTDPSTSTTPR